MSANGSHSAPGQAAGYYYQIDRALALLASADANSVIAVEKEDDVSVRLADGSLSILEQDKHTITGRFPFGDHSRALWNTLAIWSDLIATGQVSATCRFMMVTNVAMREGLAQSCANAVDDLSINRCIRALKNAARTVPASLQSLATTVCGRDASVLSRLVKGIQFLDAGCASEGAALRKKAASALHIPDDISEIDILNTLHGWIAQLLLESWTSGKPGLLLRTSFDKQLHRQIENVRKHRRFGLPAHLVDISRIERRLHLKKVYVKQLSLVKCKSDEILDAIDDFVRCSTERFRLASEGDLTKDDWIDFEGSLKTSWNQIFNRELRLSAGTDDADIGYKILCDTREVKSLLGNVDAHSYIVRGTYHRFADGKEIGWHPQFTSLI